MPGQPILEYPPSFSSSAQSCTAARLPAAIMWWKKISVLLNLVAAPTISHWSSCCVAILTILCSSMSLTSSLISSSALLTIAYPISSPTNDSQCCESDPLMYSCCVLVPSGHSTEHCALSAGYLAGKLSLNVCLQPRSSSPPPAHRSNRRLILKPESSSSWALLHEATMVRRSSSCSSSPSLAHNQAALLAAIDCFKSLQLLQLPLAQ
eukprot:CAMPEP_0114134150 /NCGR_PEP_ID=MMETSP0043_2-20121206/14000_1 /TAXON_ID=464988 /ORGANISM="Hemiselmis andersenii, Strain CCMP644" /LENGTH=207 /DNA_ID=CAMNT_0001227763 /DNA_START=239 /DNA_END=862 /DNA_ORIENTATION=-